MNSKNKHNTKAFRENPLICNVQIQFHEVRVSRSLMLFLFILGCSKDKFEVKPNDPDKILYTYGCSRRNF